jgi:hypothetical protein
LRNARKITFLPECFIWIHGILSFDASLIPNKCYPINSARAAITAVGLPAAYLIINISFLVRYASLSRRYRRNYDKFPWDAVFVAVPTRLDRT